MAGSAGGGDDEMITGINVTPLVDIVLVLLIIFMVTASYITRAQIGVDLPKAASGASELKTTLTFKISKEGVYAINDKPATLDEIAAFVRAEKKKDKDVRAVIAADKGVDYGSVIDLIDTVKLNGVEKFALNIERKGKAQ
jgi:biopolymer transport protein ExbD